uniref:Ovule protein n=1 Tax=Schistocephalus solidus TaxID=70667 RepID=A0A183TUN3_SCHSO
LFPSPYPSPFALPPLSSSQPTPLSPPTSPLRPRTLSSLSHSLSPPLFYSYLTPSPLLPLPSPFPAITWGRQTLTNNVSSPNPPTVSSGESPGLLE